MEKYVFLSFVFLFICGIVSAESDLGNGEKEIVDINTVPVFIGSLLFAAIWYFLGEISFLVAIFAVVILTCILFFFLKRKEYHYHNEYYDNIKKGVIKRNIATFILDIF